MSGHMPYQLEKGPYFSVSEAVLEDIDLRIASSARKAGSSTRTPTR